MSGSNGTALTDIQGVVASINDHGLKLQGESDWRNYSRFAAPGAIVPVAAGTPVLISLDKSNFVRVLSPIGTAPAPAQLAAAAAPSAQHTAPDVKDQRITRMASINAANAYLQHNQHAYTVEDLLSTAATIEAWVLR